MFPKWNFVKEIVGQLVEGACKGKDVETAEQEQRVH
jgi:hypothetical protein